MGNFWLYQDASGWYSLYRSYLSISKLAKDPPEECWRILEDAAIVMQSVSVKLDMCCRETSAARRTRKEEIANRSQQSLLESIDLQSRQLMVFGADFLAA